jgi:hypothetical protein
MAVVRSFIVLYGQTFSAFQAFFEALFVLQKGDAIQADYGEVPCGSWS